MRRERNRGAVSSYCEPRCGASGAGADCEGYDSSRAEPISSNCRRRQGSGKYSSCRHQGERSGAMTSDGGRLRSCAYALMRPVPQLPSIGLLNWLRRRHLHENLVRCRACAATSNRRLRMDDDARRGATPASDCGLVAPATPPQRDTCDEFPQCPPPPAAASGPCPPTCRRQSGRWPGYETICG